MNVPDLDAVEALHKAATIDYRKDRVAGQEALFELMEVHIPALIAHARELREALLWALSELYVPNQGSDPEYGLHHQAARALVGES